MSSERPLALRSLHTVRTVFDGRSSDSLASFVGVCHLLDFLNCTCSAFKQILTKSRTTEVKMDGYSTTNSKVGFVNVLGSSL